MTYKMKLYELFPKAHTKDIERITVTNCCMELFHGVKKCYQGTCTQCWNTEVKE